MLDTITKYGKQSKNDNKNMFMNTNNKVLSSLIAVNQSIGDVTETITAEKEFEDLIAGAGNLIESNPNQLNGQLNGNLDNIAPFPFCFTGQYIVADDGTPVYLSSSNDDLNRQRFGVDELADIVINNSTIRELVPSVKKEDIYLNQHMLMMKVKRGVGEDELFRIDIIGNNILVQAPYEYPYPWGSTIYKYVSVPVSSEVGKKILQEKNYKVKVTDDIIASESIFRAEECDA